MRGIVFRELQDALKGLGISQEEIIQLTLMVQGPMILAKQFKELRDRLGSERAGQIADVLRQPRGEWRKNGFSNWAIEAAEAFLRWSENTIAISAKSHQRRNWKIPGEPSPIRPGGTNANDFSRRRDQTGDRRRTSTRSRRRHDPHHR